MAKIAFINVVFAILGNLVLLLPGILAAETADRVRTIWGPNNRYACQIQPSDTSDEVIYFQDATHGKRTKILSTSRWAEVLWSPSDGWFCINDHSDTHSNQLHVYHADKTAFGNVICELVWSSLDSGPDTDWELLGWRMDKGEIKIKCDYARDYNDHRKGWLTKVYPVPIFLPEQVGN
jgi:hypothetical protein